METLLLKITPLMIGSALSPGIFAIVLVILSRKEYLKRKIFSYFVGAILSAIIAIIVAFLVGTTPGVVQNKHDVYKAAIDIIIAIAFAFLGLKSFFEDPRTGNSRKFLSEDGGKPGLVRWLTIGFLMGFLNFDNEFMFLVAVREVSHTDIETLQKVITTIIATIVYLIPIELPLILYFIFPRTADKILIPFSVFLKKYSRYIIGAIFLIFGFYLFYNGLRILL